MKSYLYLFLALFTIIQLTAQNVSLVADLNAQTLDSSPHYSVELNDVVYFQATNNDNERGLWRYDINSQIAEQLSTNHPSYITVFQNKIYFMGTGDTSEPALHYFDPENENIIKIADNNDAEINTLSSLFAFDDKLFLDYWYPNMGLEPSYYDPITNSIHLLAEVVPNTWASSHPSDYTIMNGELYLSINDLTDTGTLWKYSPITETIEKVSYSTTNNQHPIIYEMIAFENKLLCQGETNELGAELWLFSLADNSFSLLADIHTGTANGHPRDFIFFQDYIYFNAQTAPFTRSFWRFNPQNNTIEMVSDINALDFRVVANQLYFEASLEDTGQELYTYDPITETITLVQEINVGPLTSTLNMQVATEEHLFVAANRTDVGRELWQYTPSTNTYHLTKDIRTHNKSSSPEELIRFGEDIYFSAENTDGWRELWHYSPSNEQLDIIPHEVAHLNPEYLTVLDEKLYFSGNTATYGNELLVYHPIENSITLAADITPNGSSNILHCTAYAGKLFFSAIDGIHGQELWFYDPQTETANLLADINTSQGQNSNSYPAHFFVYQDKLYFQADDGSEYGNELWQYDDATGEVSLVADIFPGSPGSRPLGFFEYDNLLWFGAYAPPLWDELYSYNGTTGELQVHTDMPSACCEVIATAYQDKFYFRGTDEPFGELYAYNPATSEVEIIADIGGDVTSHANYFIVHNDLLYFSAETVEHGRELWVYNDTMVTQVADIHIGEGDAHPFSMLSFEEELYFAATDVAHGRELWKLSPETVAVNALDHISSFQIYPNPNCGSFHIDFQAIRPNELNIYNTQGQLVFQQEISELSTFVEVVLLNLSAGFYVISVKTFNEIYTQKLIIQSNN